MEITYELENIDEAVAEFWQYAKGYRVWALTGDLGAGKTTFVGAICRYLGTDTSASSPTFSLVNEYRFPGPEGKEMAIFHADWYRLGDAEEAISAGMEDMMERKDGYCIIEWPERAPELLPADTLYVSFTLQSDTRRLLTLSPQEIS